jgi:hypothetical protein
MRSQRALPAGYCISFNFDPVESRRGLCDTQAVPKRPRDPSQLAKQVLDIAIGEAEDTVSESKRHPSPKRKGGTNGGKARAKNLSPPNGRQLSS